MEYHYRHRLTGPEPIGVTLDLDTSNRAARPQEQDERNEGRRPALRQNSNALLRLMAAVMALALLFAAAACSDDKGGEEPQPTPRLQEMPKDSPS